MVDKTYTYFDWDAGQVITMSKLLSNPKRVIENSSV